MSLDALELELRRLPGVRAAGFQERDDLLLVQLQIGAEAAEPNLALQASQIATRHSEKNVAVELVRWRTLQAPPGVAPEADRRPAPPSSAPVSAPEPAPMEPRTPDALAGPAVGVPDVSPAAETTPADAGSDEPEAANAAADAAVDSPGAPVIVDAQEPNPVPPVLPAQPPTPTAAPAPEGEGTRERRVRLLTVLSFPDADELEVHLTLDDQRTIGRSAASRGLLGSVEATIDALSEFLGGPRFTPAWTRTLETGTHQYLVVIGLDGPDDIGRYGIAGGDSPLEAAARATLHALNRSVETGPAPEAPSA